jgi:hypothetical protein
MSRIGQDIPRFIALLACESATKDPASGLWSVKNIFDVMELETFPIVVPKFDIYLALGRAEGSDDKQRVYLALLSPEGQIITQTHLFIEWSTAPQAEFGQTFHGVIFPKAGRYTLRLFVEGHVLAERAIITKAAGAADGA